MEQKQKTLRLFNSPESPLTEQQIVEATVAFANGARLEIEGLVKDRWGKSGEEKVEADLKLAQSLAEVKGLGLRAISATTAKEYRKSLSTAVRARLAQILRDRPGAAKYYVDRGLEGVIPVKPVLRATSIGLAYSFYYAFSTYRDLVLIGEILLADGGRGHSDKLCQCQFSDCGQLFFERKPPTGRPQRRYCSREHMLKAHDENAAQRMARKRPARRGK